MYPISNAVKALFESEQRQVLRITGTDKNGTAINITDADVVIGSFSIDRFSCIGNKLEIGTATSAQMNVKLDNHDGRFNGIVFEGTELFVEIGIADWTQSNPTVNWIPCGYFTPDEQPRKLTTIRLKALDRMVWFDSVALMFSSIPWTNENGVEITTEALETIYFQVGITFPTTVSNLVSTICEQCGVPLAESISALPNANLTIATLPEIQQDITMRNLLQWCAGIMGTCAYIDWNGELRFAWYNKSTGYTSTTANRYESDLYENPIVITGVKYSDNDEEKTLYLAGTDEYALDLSGNALINADNAETVVLNIYNAVHDFAYTPFSASVVSAPWLWPMDRVTFTDKHGNGHVSSLTNVAFGLNGTTAIASKGETAQMSSYADLSGFTFQQQQEISRIQRVNSTAMEQAVEHATQMITGGLGGYVILKVNETTGQTEEILIMDTPDTETAVNVWRFNQGGLGHSSNGYNGPFNDVALTADGKINANMITIGTMVADRIMGGTLTLGGYNNTNGTLIIKDYDDNVSGTWTASRITGKSFQFDAKNDSYIKMTNPYSGDNKIKLDYIGMLYNYRFYNGNENYPVDGYIYIKGSYYDSEHPTDYAGITCYESFENVPQVGYAYKSHYDPSHLQIEKILGNTSLATVELTCNYLVYKVNGVVQTSYASTYANIGGNLSVTGTKSRLVETDQYSDRLLYCYETPSPMFGDIGEGVIADDGLCYITLDAVFAQTITTDRYQVFLQKYGDGDCWIKERKGGYFIVQGTPGMAFGWEIKAKQRDYDQRRLDKAEEPYHPETTDYGELASQHIQDIQKEREIAA